MEWRGKECGMKERDVEGRDKTKKATRTKTMKSVATERVPRRSSYTFCAQ